MDSELHNGLWATQWTLGYAMDSGFSVHSESSGQRPTHKLPVGVSHRSNRQRHPQADTSPFASPQNLYVQRVRFWSIRDFVRIVWDSSQR